MTANSDFVIAIGRQFGSGGRELGKELSRRLGVPFYDKELLMQAAVQSGVNPELLINNDERAPRFINGTLSFSYGVNPLPWYAGFTSVSDDNLYHVQSSFIQDIAGRGPCIIVGRTADYVLREHPGLVSVFVHADMADCVNRILSRSDTKDPEKARKMAEKINKLRANYYNFYTDKRWGDAAGYDMCFNSSKIAIPDIADMIIGYLQRRGN